MNLEFLKTTGFSTLVLQPDGKTSLWEIPFLDRMGFVFVICVLGMYIISKIETAKGVATNGLEIDSSMFKTNKGFLAGALIIGGILVALYSIFW